MLIVYATIQADNGIEQKDKKVHPSLDKHNLENKIVVMDEEYFLSHVEEFNNMRVILITKSNIDKSIDVECYPNLESLVNNSAFDNRELYIVGGYKLLKEGMKYADTIINNYVSNNDLEIPTLYFPNIDVTKWALIKVKEETPKVLKLVYRKY